MILRYWSSALTNWAIKPNLRKEKDLHCQAKLYVALSFYNKTSLLGYVYSGDTIIQVTHCSPCSPKSKSSIEWTLLFRGHLSWSLGCPLNGGSTVLCLYQLPLLNGLLYLGDTWPGPEVIPRWMIHCIMFVSVTSVEWTPLFRGHLAWPWGYPLTYYYYGGSTVLFLYQLPLLKGHRYSGDTWPGPECVCWSDISFQGTPGRPGPECVFWMDAPLYYEWAFSEFPQASIKTRLSAQPLIWKWFSFSCK